MRRRIKRSSLFTMVAIVALFSLGVGYAAWSDQLDINGTVNTGDLNMEWAATAPTSSAAVTGSSATCSASGSGKVLTVTMNEVYPGFSCDITGTIVQSGSVPGEVTAVNVTSNTAGAAATIDTCDELVGGDIGANTNCVTTVSFDSNDNATQNQTYTFTVEIDFVNAS